MEPVLARIKSRMPSLTPNGAKAAKYISRHPDEVISNSINELARKAGVSVASVSRLATTLGYRDWKDMRLSFARDSNNRDNFIYADIDPNDPHQVVIQKIFDGNAASLRETCGQIDNRAVLKVVQALLETDRVVFFGCGGSGVMALDEGIRFSHLDYSADAYTDEYTMLIQASKLKKSQVAFGFSHSGRTRTLVAAMTEARRRRAVTIGIANFRNTPLEAAAELFFHAVFPRQGSLTASLTGRLALLSLMDVFYVLAAQHGRMGHNSEIIDKTVEAHLRLANRYATGPRKRRK
ncbi:MAG: MurR/RpiR family transcriptional regulator [Planctomycetota bacterium]|nr:MurR/RpiR family transcriptional regulator [Planctomycetota bacterium]